MCKRILLVLCFLLIPSLAKAQVVDSNAGNYRDPRTVFVNPAASGLNNDLFLAAGFEKFYLGLANNSIQSGFAAVTYPIGPFGNAGFTAQYFSADVYRQGLYSITFGRPLMQEKVCLGFDLGLRNISYNLDNFYMGDPSDPVFLGGNSKNSLDFGVSALLNPRDSVYLGLSARHLNEPNISLVDDPIKVPMKLQAGLRVDYGSVAPLLNIAYQDEESDWDVGVESWFLEDHAMLTGSYGQEDIRFGAAYVLDSSENSLRLDYQFRYPVNDLHSITSGFHQFVISYAPQKREEDPAASRLWGTVESSTDTLLIEEIVRIRRQNPVLAKIFFAENKFTLDTRRYEILNPDRNPLGNFIFFPEAIQDIPTQYRNTLNTIARRLWDNPEMKITVTGCNSGWGAEEGNLALSTRRAEIIQEYLVQNCGVNLNQVEVKARQLPRYAADSGDRRGRQENQRVEISSTGSSTPVLEPVITETVEIETSHNLCILPIKNLITDAGLTNWEVIIESNSGQTFKTISGTSVPVENPTWDWRGDDGQLVQPGTSYSYQLLLEDTTGETFVSDKKTIVILKATTVEEEIIERQIEVTRLVLFKYDNDRLDLESTALREQLNGIVDRMIELPTSTLEVKGHTDIIGLPEYNQKLSMRRAHAVVDYFLGRGIARSRITSAGFGNSKPIMDNELPEGRMINRRVEIFLSHVE